MRIVCILGRSGSGKSSVERSLEKLGFNRIISYTTREKRVGEVDGVDYNFISKEQFKRLIDLDALMEYTEYANNFYGAPKPIGTYNNIIVVESDGYKKIKELYGDQVTGVYIDTPINISESRALSRDGKNTDRKERNKADDEKFKDIKDIVDIVVDGTLDIQTQTATIINYALHREKL